jgi:hypothetical protein
MSQRRWTTSPASDGKEVVLGLRSGGAGVEAVVPLWAVVWSPSRVMTHGVYDMFGEFAIRQETRLCISFMV